MSNELEQFKNPDIEEVHRRMTLAYYTELVNRAARESRSFSDIVIADARDRSPQLLTVIEERADLLPVYHFTTPYEGPYGNKLRYDSERLEAASPFVEKVTLSSLEGKIFERLMRQPYRVHSSSSLAEALWGDYGTYPDDESHAIRQRVGYLRHKLGDTNIGTPGTPLFRLIHTIVGIGYTLAPGIRTAA